MCSGSRGEEEGSGCAASSEEEHVEASGFDLGAAKEMGRGARLPRRRRSPRGMLPQRLASGDGRAQEPGVCAEDGRRVGWLARVERLHVDNVTRSVG